MLVSAQAEKRRQLRLARGRRPTEAADFLVALARAGVDEGTGIFLLEEIRAYYFSPLTPEPDDRVFSTMRIDPADVEDMAIRFWERFDLAMPGPDEPARLPANPSLIELALWLDSHRHAER